MAHWPYNTARWQRVRKRQLNREPICRVCAELGDERPANEVDHIVPIARGGAPFDPANLQSLCQAHHSIKTKAFDMQGKDWRQWEMRGANPDGTPRDPTHPWHAGGDRSQ